MMGILEWDIMDGTVKGTICKKGQTSEDGTTKIMILEACTRDERKVASGAGLTCSLGVGVRV